PRRVGDPLSIRREVEASLHRLDVERIDLSRMQWPAEDGTLLEDYWGTLLQLKEEGKVRAVGLSNHDVRQLNAAERVGHVDTLQPPFSAIHREVAAAELPWCAAHRTGVIVYSPMQSGLLTGAFSVERAARLGADDWRSRSPDFTDLGLHRNVALADALRPIAQRHGATVAAVAVAWTLAGQRRAPLVQLDNAIESLVHDVSPSIVQVLVTGIGPVPAPGRTLAVAHEQVIGSGVIVDSAGFIITNAHVVAGAQRVEVIVTPSRTAAGERLPPRAGPLLAARIVGLDRVTDLAVLKVDTTGLAALPFAD